MIKLKEDIMNFIKKNLNSRGEVVSLYHNVINSRYEVIIIGDGTRSYWCKSLSDADRAYNYELK